MSMCKRFGGFFILFFILMLVLFSFCVSSSWIGLTSCPNAVTGSGTPFLAEWSYDVNVTGSIDNFSMYFNDNWHLDTNYLNCYLWINGVSMGSANGSTHVCSPDVGSDDLIYWDWFFGLTFTDDPLVFEVYYNGSAGAGGAFRMLSAAGTYADIDSDGDKYFHKIACNDNNYLTYIDGLVNIGDRTAWWPGYDYGYSFNLTSGSSVGNSTLVEDYLDTWGDFFVQFAYYDEGCYYNIGDVPYIVYNLSSVSLGSGNYYKWFIYTSDDFPIKSGLLNAGTFGVASSYTTFPSAGDYYLVLYNMTSDGLVSDVVFYSEAVTVCDSSSSGVGDVDSDMSFYLFMLGICIPLCCIVIPIALFKDSIFVQDNGRYLMLVFGLLGFGISIYYNLLDISIGYIIAIVCVAYVTMAVYRAISRG